MHERVHATLCAEQKPVDPRKPFSDLIIPTPESVSYSWMIEHICTQMKHVLCIGPTGENGRILMLSTHHACVHVEFEFDFAAVLVRRLASPTKLTRI